MRRRGVNTDVAGCFEAETCQTTDDIVPSLCSNRRVDIQHTDQRLSTTTGVTYFASNFFARSAHKTLGKLNSKQFLTTSILPCFKELHEKPIACEILQHGRLDY